MAFATPADISARWRALSQAEQDRATALLDDAEWWLKVWFIPTATSRPWRPTIRS